jgi:hypothetical protein
LKHVTLGQMERGGKVSMLVLLDILLKIQNRPYLFSNGTGSCSSSY